MDSLRDSASFVLALAVSLLLGSTLFAQQRATSMPTTRPNYKSPEVTSDGRVTFRFWAPQAHEVIVQNIGPGGNSYTSRSPMTQDQRGLWSFTTEPIAPDIYQYTFLVDGVQTLDPMNTKLQTGFHAHQSQVHVPGNEVWDAKSDTEHGAVTHHFFHSSVANDDRDFWVYTPPNYDPKRAEGYPVLFLLHGLGDRADSWIENGAANVILDNLINAGQAKPMIMVNTLGYARGGGPANAFHDDLVPRFGRTVLEEVLPRVEKTYNVAKDPAHRAIAGLSMGGAESSYIGLNHLDTFGYIGVFSGAFSLWPSGMATSRPSFHAEMIGTEFPHLADSAKQIKLLWIACGTADGLIEMNRTFHGWLNDHGVASTYKEVPDVGHVWPLWRRNLAEFAQLIFKD